MGVDKFFITAHINPNLDSDEKSNIYLSLLNKCKNSNDISINSSEYFHTAKRSREKHDKIQSKIDDHDWIVWADIDEFQEYWDDLDSITRYCEKKDVNFIQGVLIDRIDENGLLKQFDNSSSIWSQFPLGSNLTQKVLKGGIDKVVISKANVAVGRGNHIVLPGQFLKTIKKNAVVHHFKWDHSVKERLKYRLSDDWKKEASCWIETERFYKHIGEYNRLNLKDLDLYDPQGYTQKFFLGQTFKLPSIYNDNIYSIDVTT